MTSCCPSQTSIEPISSQFSIALIGNPNCGKTTLFNALTGTKQRVGNWPGVTVEQKTGFFTEAGVTIQAIDLPGIYSLIQASEAIAVDEKITSHYILEQQADLIINIIDASHLERHLYLTLQLREMGIPMLIVLNMMDIVKLNHQHIHIEQLSQLLQCPVIAIEAHKGLGLKNLKQTIVNIARSPLQQTSPFYHDIPGPIQVTAAALAAEKNVTPWQVLRLLEGDIAIHKFITPAIMTKAREQQTILTADLTEDIDILLANSRYCAIQHMIQQTVTAEKPNKNSPNWTARIDNIVLNRFLGLPIFFGIMYLLFFFSINVGGAFQDFFDISSQTIFVDGFAHLLTQCHVPTWLTVILANGVGKGINTTITFIPVIGSMFLFLSFLEDSGYMARAAFIIDRFMRLLGLPGKAFVPMIVGFGCNVPAVMGARTLTHERDRILTIMMAPFMSCGARLAIFSVFTTAFFPHNGQNIIFALYLIGIAMAMLTGFILRYTVLKGEISPLIMELPSYHLPHLPSLCLHAWHKLKSFVFRAGKLIVPICVLIGALNALNIDGSMNDGNGDTQSILSAVGKSASPIFSPMGITTDNWPATVGLVTGVLAKEVVVGTLNTLYTQMGLLNTIENNESFKFGENILNAIRSIPENLAELSHSIINPLAASPNPINQGVYGLMYQKFDGQIGAFAYLLFILLYFPCVSTLGAMLREAHKGWSWFSMVWMTGVAYGTAVFFYQAATWLRHPLSSTLWMASILICFFSTIITIRLMTATPAFIVRDLKKCSIGDNP